MSHDDGSLSSPPGVYELCLFANDGFSRLATSPPFALGSRSFYNPYNAHVPHACRRHARQMVVALNRSEGLGAKPAPSGGLTRQNAR